MHRFPPNESERRAGCPALLSGRSGGRVAGGAAVDRAGHGALGGATAGRVADGVLGGARCLLQVVGGEGVADGARPRALLGLVALAAPLGVLGVVFVVRRAPGVVECPDPKLYD